MRVSRKDDVLTVRLNRVEAPILLQVLRSIHAGYRVRPEAVDPRLRVVWYSSRGCAQAGMSAEEIREWQGHLHEFKSANLSLIERWVNGLVQQGPGGCRLQLTLDEASRFLTVLNDQRLRLAALHGIGQEEMDCQTLRQMSRLKPAQQSALAEIHVLAYLMEETLRQL